MTIRRWWIAGIVALAIVVAVILVVVFWVLPRSSHSDCATVRHMIDYNRSYNEKMTAQYDSENPSETSLSDYRAWAVQLRSYADTITDPGLASRADHIAALADQGLAIVKQSHEDPDQSSGPGPPPWVVKYAAVSVQFNGELDVLAQACPA